MNKKRKRKEEIEKKKTKEGKEKKPDCKNYEKTDDKTGSCSPGGNPHVKTGREIKPAPSYRAVQLQRAVSSEAVAVWEFGYWASLTNWINHYVAFFLSLCILTVLIFRNGNGQPVGGAGAGRMQHANWSDRLFFRSEHESSAIRFGQTMHPILFALWRTTILLCALSNGRHDFHPRKNKHEMKRKRKGTSLKRMEWLFTHTQRHWRADPSWIVDHGGSHGDK